MTLRKMEGQGRSWRKDKERGGMDINPAHILYAKSFILLAYILLEKLKGFYLTLYSLFPLHLLILRKVLHMKFLYGCTQ